jgi:hypothetical protein
MDTEIDGAVLEAPADLTDAVGSAVLTDGVDAAGESAVGLWLVSPSGQASGAWVLARTAPDQEQLRDLLLMCRGRALVSDTPDQGMALWGELHRMAGVTEARSSSGHAVSLPGLLDDVRRLRQVCEEALTAERVASGKKLAALGWGVDIPDSPLATVEDMRMVAGLAVPAGAEVASKALTVVAVLRWVVGAWREAVDVCARRDYLTTRTEQPSPLPSALWTSMDVRR